MSGKDDGGITLNPMSAGSRGRGGSGASNASRPSRRSRRMSMLDMRGSASALIPPPSKVKEEGCTRQVVIKIVQSWQFDLAIIVAIIANAIVIGIATNQLEVGDDTGDEGAWAVVEHCFVALFLVEMILKLVAQQCNFWKDGWNCFDAVLVCTSVLDMWILTPIIEDTSFLIALPILRALRVARVARLARIAAFFKELHLLWGALLNSLRSLFWLLILMLTVMYISAVMLTRLIGKNGVYDDDPALRADIELWFGSVSGSMYTLFQIMTLESWSMGIVRPVLAKQPLMWLFFIPYIIGTTLMILNLITGAVVDKTLGASALKGEEKRRARRDQMDAVMPDLEAVFAEMDTDGDELLDLAELKAGLNNPKIVKTLQKLDIPIASGLAETVFAILDDDHSGHVSFVEFLHTLMALQEDIGKMDFQLLQANVARLDRLVTGLHDQQRRDSRGIDMLLEASGMRPPSLDTTPSHVGGTGSPRRRPSRQPALKAVLEGFHGPGAGAGAALAPLSEMEEDAGPPSAPPASAGGDAPPPLPPPTQGDGIAPPLPPRDD